MGALTGTVLGHKRLVVGLWVLVTLAAFAAVGPANDALSNEFSIPGREGFETNEELASIYGNGGDVAPIVPVVTLPAGTDVDSPGVRAELGAALAKIEAALPGAIRVLRLDPRRGVRLRRRPHDVRARLRPAQGGVEPGQAEARAAQAALEGVTVGGAPVEVTGLDALRPPPRAARRAGRAWPSRRRSLAASARCWCSRSSSPRSWRSCRCSWRSSRSRRRSCWSGRSPRVTDVSVIVKFLIALVGLAIAIDYALLVVVRWREERERGIANEQAVRSACSTPARPWSSAARPSAISLLALRRAAGAVPAQHRHRRDADPAGQRRGRDHPAAGRARHDRARGSTGRASAATSAASRAMDRLGAARRPPPLDGGGRVDRRARRAGRRAPPRSSSATRRPTRSRRAGGARAGLEQLERSGIGTGPLSPFDALVRSGDPGAVAGALAGVEGVRDARRRRTGAGTGPRWSP